MAYGDHLRVMPLDGRVDDVCFEHSAPFGLDRHHLGAQAPADLDFEMTETPEDRHQELVTGRKCRRQARLDAGSGRAVDQYSPVVLGTKYATVETHHLVHIGRKLWVELTLQGYRHGSQNARI